MAQPPGIGGVERVRSRPPEDPSWRADALAASRHSRWLDELREPLEDHDPERAADLCGQVARSVLEDLAPALLLLPGELRHRARILTAYALTLFDFAAQGGLEGERLAQINRWEFSLELALDGRPPGQPIFVALAAEERRRPWPREALDRIAGAARRRITRPRPASAERLAAEARELAGALAEALAGDPAADSLTALGAAALRVWALQHLAESLRRGRPRLPCDELPPPGDGAFAAPEVARAVAQESRRVRQALAAAADTRPRPPRELAATARYLRLAAAALLRQVDAGAAAGPGTPRLGAGARMALLARARFGALFRRS